VIFGSVAAGRAKAESDVDLLIMAKELPESYSDRLRPWRGIVAEIESERLKLRRKKRLYPLIDPILLMPSEAERIQPFYLDLLDNSIIVYDKDEFVQWVLNDLRARLKALDTIKVKSPSSSWYWIIKPSAGFGKVIRV
jgi:predicted nucleotidyltransferase